MKLLLFLLLFQQKDFANNQIMVSGITMIENLHYSFCVSVLGQAIKGDAYVDLKIHIPNEKILGPVFIKTNNGQFSPLPIQYVNKNGYSIIRLFFRLSDQWTSIDTGITFIVVKTRENVYRIQINNNLSNLKNYAK